MRRRFRTRSRDSPEVKGLIFLALGFYGATMVGGLGIVLGVALLGGIALSLALLLLIGASRFARRLDDGSHP